MSPMSKKLITLIGLVIIALCIYLGYNYIFPSKVDTKPVDNGVKALKQELSQKEKELEEMKKKSQEKQIIIQQTVKDEIRKLPQDQVAKEILKELEE